MNLKFVLYALAMAMAVNVSAQRKILCRIADKETNQPIKDVQIALEGTSTTTATNYLGFFELIIDSAHQILTVKHPEYVALRVVVPPEDKFRISLERRTIQEDNSETGKAFYMHVSKNLKYPQEARRGQIQGIVRVQFAIDANGVASDLIVLRDIGGGCGQEVVRAIKSLPASFGQLLADETSSRKFILPVHFGIGEAYPASKDPIAAQAGVFVLKEVNLTAIGIERTGSMSTQSGIRIVDETSHETLSTALKNPKSAKKLSLINQGITSFPTDIITLTNLEFLDLDQNKLNTVPPEIGKLTKLEGLFFFDNDLYSLPPTIANLTKLKTLGLASNHFKSIPAQVFTLEKLEALDLSGNQVEEIPAEIGALKNLRTLGLNNNLIKTIPAEILQLKKLEKIFIQGNPIPAEEINRIKLALKKVEVVYN